MRRLPTTIKTVLAALLLFLFMFAGPAESQSDAAVNVPEAAAAIEQTGRFLEVGAPADVLAAIERANAQNVAFVWLNQAGDGANVARSIATELGARQSRYGAVVVLTGGSVYANGVSEASAAMDSATTGIFGTGNVAAGLDAFVQRLGGAAGSGAPSTGGGFPWIIPILLAGVAFIGFRMVSGRRKTKRIEDKTIEADRAEIKEQLKNNADRVMTFGDRVIKSGDSVLISLYEEASQSYQEVSQNVDSAVTAVEVDLLDDRIDKAEWQFDVIEAKLENRSAPPFPVDPDDGPLPPPPQHGGRDRPLSDRPLSDRSAPALGRDESVLGRSAAGQHRQPQPPRQTQQPRRRRSRGGAGIGGLLTSGLGRMALSVLASVVMGGGMGRPRTSRRTQRRGGDLGSILGGGRGSGGLGGVLRRR